MEKKILLSGCLAILLISLLISLGCGKKASPTPRDQVLEKQSQKQISKGYLEKEANVTSTMGLSPNSKFVQI